MNRSDDIKDLILALQKAQAEITIAPYDSTNPHFKSKFASLNSVMDAVKPQLLKNGLTVTQWLDALPEGPVLISMLLHTSGQFISSAMPLLLIKNDMQSMGSAISYARRYALSAITGVVSDEDDDGSAATKAKERVRAINQKISSGEHDEPEMSEPVIPGDYILKAGANKGKRVRAVPSAALIRWLNWYDDQKARGATMHEDVMEAAEYIAAHLASQEGESA